ncbi:hypothetical protein FRC02_011695 [Tulasnella sp. 418]|nr:hypothetical protein FRC02_011695 [Tulasnella sp. 418]
MVSPKHSKSTLSPLNFTPSSRSPASGSMTSSPTSIHSSSSAIFERDIHTETIAQEPTSSVIDVVPPTPNTKHINFSSGNASPSPLSTSSPLTPPPIALPQPRIRKPQGGSPSRPTSLVGTGPQ